jgi:hypothetical protein
MTSKGKMKRSAQAARKSNKKVVYGGGYENVFPHVVECL